MTTTISFSGSVVQSTSLTRYSLPISLDHAISNVKESLLFTVEVDTGDLDEIALGGLEEADFLYMSSDQNVTVFLNESLTGILLVAKSVLLLSGTTVAALSIDNDSGNRAKVTIFMGNKESV